MGLIGINMPWVVADQDFGPPSGAPPWKPDLEAELKRLKDLGFSVLRWWLIPFGEYYPPPPLPPALPPGGREKGMTLPSARSGDLQQFIRPLMPSNLSDQFLSDFDSMLAACKKHDFKVIPCLTSFDFCLISHDLPKGSRAELLFDDAKSALFIGAVLEPLVRVASKYRDTIMAFDVMNEPEWCTDTPSPPGPNLRQPNVPYNKMIRFLQKACATINAAGLRSTVGFCAGSIMSRDSSIPLAVPEIHLYGSPLNHDISSIPIKGKIVGEIAAYQETLNRGGRPLKLGDQIIYLLSQGAEAVLLWPDKSQGRNVPDFKYPSEALTDYQKSEVRRAVLAVQSK